MTNTPPAHGSAPRDPRRLTRHARIQGTITCRSGLHIGAGKDEIEIGGTDNPIIRDPLTTLPYIPGSSLKGKLRALLELRDGHYRDNGAPGGDARPNCLICRVFGPHMTPNHTLGPTRIIVRDSFVTPEWRARLEDLQATTGLAAAEMKSENLVLRTTGVALHPRTLERVPAGVTFTLDISVRLFDDDDTDAILTLITDGLTLIEGDALGAGGSRGSGSVAFTYTYTITPGSDAART